MAVSHISYVCIFFRNVNKWLTYIVATYYITSKALALQRSIFRENFLLKRLVSFLTEKSTRGSEMLNNGYRERPSTITLTVHVC